ncbi:hypothetical protein LNK20_12240 [Bacillus safensis]|uniref:hypothetical protein n=1 Tax=Bacillus TaxID=1386 RepID=UPI00057D27A1|nr:MULTISPECIES: hypothetical protein [Bacillus]AIZ60931.1 hypothetical protein QR42_11860 [Bacillus sp. WP8]MBU5206994.1 hypothetical protein [Bacillus safensis]MCK1973462.1 hypothetical protein [Bacillus safensis]MED1575512.1 hypothetical protein [Bacillus safensis]RUK49124.1 hypothetical protein ELP67_03550 [Bacillus safensis]
MHLKNIQLMSDDDHGILASQSLCMTEMFLYELEKRLQTKDCEAIVLICGSFKDYKLISTSKEEPNMLFLKNTYELEVPFCYSEFGNATNKKKILADTLEKAMLYLCELKNWDSQLVKATFKKMKEKEYKAEIKGKTKLSPDKKKKAYPLIKLDLKQFTLYLVVEDNKRNILDKKLIAETDTYLEEVSYHMRELKWLTDHEAALFKRTHKTVYTSIRLS